MKWKRDQWEESQAGLRDNPKSHQILGKKGRRGIWAEIENLGEWRRRLNEPCGKEKGEDETGQKVLVGGGSRTGKTSEHGDVRWMMPLS